jgi:hypothetical protein
VSGKNTLLHRLTSRLRTTPFSAEDFEVGQQVRLCGRAFGWPIGSLLQVTGFHSQGGKHYVMITPVSGTGEYGIESGMIEPHACPDCPHPKRVTGFITDILV